MTHLPVIARLAKPAEAIPVDVPWRLPRFTRNDKLQSSNAKSSSKFQCQKEAIQACQYLDFNCHLDYGVWDLAKATDRNGIIPMHMEVENDQDSLNI